MATVGRGLGLAGRNGVDGDSGGGPGKSPQPHPRPGDGASCIGVAGGLQELPWSEDLQPLRWTDWRACKAHFQEVDERLAETFHVGQDCVRAGLSPGRSSRAGLGTGTRTGLARGRAWGTDLAGRGPGPAAGSARPGQRCPHWTARTAYRSAPRSSAGPAPAAWPAGRGDPAAGGPRRLEDTQRR